MNEPAVTRIKICGLRTPEDAAIVNEAHPAFCGFIFDRTRRRYIAPEQAEEIRRKLDPEIVPVGVFVNAAAEEILDVLEICPVGAIQLHGQESDAFIDALRERLKARAGGSPGIPFIIKAFRIDSAEDVAQAAASHADCILLDHGIGGTGEQFDWTLIRDCGRPFILAGGLNAGNVAEAIRLTHPWAVDVSSSLETDGHKDREKVLEFMQAVRS